MGHLQRSSMVSTEHRLRMRPEASIEQGIGESTDTMASGTLEMPIGHLQRSSMVSTEHHLRMRPEVSIGQGMGEGTNTIASGDQKAPMGHLQRSSMASMEHHQRMRPEVSMGQSMEENTDTQATSFVLPSESQKVPTGQDQKNILGMSCQRVKEMSQPRSK